MAGDEENALWYVWRGTAEDYVSPGLYMPLHAKFTASRYPSLSFRCDYAHLTGCSRSHWNIYICIRFPRETFNCFFLVFGQTFISKFTIIFIFVEPNFVLPNMLSRTSEDEHLLSCARSSKSTKNVFQYLAPLILRRPQ